MYVNVQLINMLCMAYLTLVICVIVWNTGKLQPLGQNKTNKNQFMNESIPFDKTLQQSYTL